MATPNPTHFLTDGNALDVRLSGSVEAGDVVYAEGWLGIAAAAGDSDDYIALTIDEREYVFDVGASLSVNKGQIVYIDPAQLENGNLPALAGYSTTSGSNIPLFKAVTAKDANNLVRGKLIVAGEA